jgi:hypothetical protein
MTNFYPFTKPIEISLPVSIEQVNLLFDPIATLLLQFLMIYLFIFLQTTFNLFIWLASTSFIDFI